MIVDGETAHSKKRKCGVRQGCVFSVDFFSLYSEMILQKTRGRKGVKVGGHKVNSRQVGDTVLTTENKESLQKLLEIVAEESRFNSSKIGPLKSLGTSILSDGRNNTEVASILAQVKKEFNKMKLVISNNKIYIHTKRRALGCSYELILIYGCKACTNTKQLQKKLEATEM